MIPLIDLYLSEMKKSDLMKLVKSADLKNIIEVMSKSSDEDKALILKSVDSSIKQELDKMIKGGLL